MRRLSYRNREFKVWYRQHTWFWFAVDPGATRGVIGAAATESEAVSEARASIKGRTAHSEEARNRVPLCSISLFLCAHGWKHSLAKLDSYITQLARDRANI
jgi:hypothetical protein